MIDKTYLPFEPKNLYKHYLGNAERQVNYFIRSVEKYHEFMNENQDLEGVPITKSMKPRQIEKDEKFWTVTALKSVFDHPNSKEIWKLILSKSFGMNPPIQGMKSWSECLKGEINLYFEAQIPSPVKYTNWLQDHIKDSHFIPYVLGAANRNSKRSLEGSTHYDAILVNGSNGFSVMFEAKVLSDISKQVTFDIKRNQLARCVDILLEENNELPEALGKRVADKSLFLLLTPNIFRENKWSRLYGWLLDEYRSNPNSLYRDLPHRDLNVCRSVASRIGWITFEDINTACPGACGWITKEF